MWPFNGKNLLYTRMKNCERENDLKMWKLIKLFFSHSLLVVAHKVISLDVEKYLFFLKEEFVF